MQFIENPNPCQQKYKKWGTEFRPLHSVTFSAHSVAEETSQESRCLRRLHVVSSTEVSGIPRSLPKAPSWSHWKLGACHARSTAYRPFEHHHW